MSGEVDRDGFDYKSAKTISIAAAFALVASVAAYSAAPAIKEGLAAAKQKCEAAIGGVERELMQYAQNGIR